MRVQTVTALPLAILIGLGALGTAEEVMQSASTLSGTWAGERIRVDGGSATVRIQVDCHVARLDRALSLDRAGGFAIEVTFVPMRGVALDGPDERPPSRVVGRIEKDVLQLTIEPDGNEPSGTFTLQRNGKAKLPNCKMRS